MSYGNILLIITDDVGFGAPSTFGGVIPTPTLDRIAERVALHQRAWQSRHIAETDQALWTISG